MSPCKFEVQKKSRRVLNDFLKNYTDKNIIARLYETNDLNKTVKYENFEEKRR